MGGLAGHIRHLHEDVDLTFGELKDVLRKATDAELEEISEKSDGFNLFITWSPQTGLRGARNKGNIKTGGMTLQQISAKFKGRDSVHDAFTNAFTILEDAVDAMQPGARQFAFAEGTVWYSLEVMYVDSPNVINYDRNNLVFHRAGSTAYDVDGKSMDDTKMDQRFDALVSQVDRMEARASKKGWAISGPGIVALKKLNDGTVLKRALGRIDAVMSLGGVSDADTIGDYMVNRMEDVIERELPWLDAKKTVGLAHRMAGLGGPKVTQLTKGLDPDRRAAVRELARRRKALSNRFIEPIEKAIYDLSIDVLRGIKSLFMVDDNKEIERLRGDVRNAIAAIESSGDDIAISKLGTHLSKLRSVDDIVTASEGIVFRYKDATYKMTGAFAPINQILDLARGVEQGSDKSEIANESLLRIWIGGMIDG